MRFFNSDLDPEVQSFCRRTLPNLKKTSVTGAAPCVSGQNCPRLTRHIKPGDAAANGRAVEFRADVQALPLPQSPEQLPALPPSLQHSE